MGRRGEGAILVGIAGISGSGKSSVARALCRELTGAEVLELDAYYRDLSHLSVEARAQHNFDHPDALDSELLIRNVQCAARGESFCCPRYDFATHTRKNESGGRYEGNKYVIVEGLLALHWPELRECFQASIFVDAPREVAFQRRVTRDVRERGRTPDSVRQQFEASVWPMAEQFVLPTRVHAQLVVSGEAPLRESVQQIRNFLNKKLAATSR